MNLVVNVKYLCLMKLITIWGTVVKVMVKVWGKGGKSKLLVRFDNPLRKSLRIEYSTDGSSFFFTLTDNQSDIWVMDLIYEEP